MKKHFVIASSLISQMVHLGSASAQTLNQDVQEKLADYLNQEALKPAAESSAQTYRAGNSKIITIKKLRSPFRHISAKLLGDKRFMSSSTESQNPPQPPTSSTSATTYPPQPPTSSTTVINPTPVQPTPPAPPTSSTSATTPQPPTSSSSRCLFSDKINFISTYQYQVTLNSADGSAAANQAPYYFANKVRQTADGVVYRVFQFTKISDLATPTAHAYMVVNTKTHQVTFSNWTP